MIDRGERQRQIVIRDSTLREGLDVAGVNLSIEQRIAIARLLERAGVTEIEAVAPGRVVADLEFARRVRGEGLRIRTSGLLYANNPRCQEEMEQAGRFLDRFDLLMSVSAMRKPYDRDVKVGRLMEVLAASARLPAEVGAGFPQSTQAETDFLLEIAGEAVKHGAKRITIYDTNGTFDPFAIRELVSRLKGEVKVPLFFHGHNDLGMATANSLAAVYAGADGLDATVNGLGDRAGNASLEQIAVNLQLRGFACGINLGDLKGLSEAVARECGIGVSPLAPVVGEYVFIHKSPGHMEDPALFEAFDPQLVGSVRELTDT